MSMSFFVSGRENRPCPSCDGEGDQFSCETTCEVCWDIGNIPDLEFGMAGASARLMVCNYLGYSETEKDVYGGALDPADVLRRLSTFQVSAHTRKGWTERSERVEITMDGVSVKQGATIHHSPYSADRVTRYLERMTELAHEACKLGKEISYS